MISLSLDTDFSVKEAFETLTLGEDKLKRSIDLGVGHLQIGVAPVALGLGDNGGHRGAVLAGDGAGQLGLVQRVIQSLAHLDIVKGRLRGVDGQTKWGDDRFENKAG